MGKQRERELVLALGGMYEQYCGGRFGHDFMSAGETACEVLREYGLIKADDELDQPLLMRLEVEGWAALSPQPRPKPAEGSDAKPQSEPKQNVKEQA